MAGTKNTIQEALSKMPRYFYLQSFITDNQIVDSNENKISLDDCDFIRGIENGLELAILNCRQLSENQNRDNFILLKSFFKLGIPSLINFSNSLQPEKVNIYMSELILELAQKQDKFLAHKNALKKTFNAFPNSLDCFWIQFWENSKALTAQKTDSFFTYDTIKEQQQNYFLSYQQLQLRKFCGYRHTFEAIKNQIYLQSLSHKDRDILWYKDKYFQNASNYLNYFAMRFFQKYHSAILYYIGDKNSIEKNLVKHDLSQYINNIQSFLFNSNNNDFIWDALYDFDLAIQPQKNNLLQVFLLAGQISDSFIRWLKSKKGWQIIIVSHENQSIANEVFTIKPSARDNVKALNLASKLEITNNINNNNSAAISYRLVKLANVLQLEGLNFANTAQFIWQEILKKIKTRFSDLALQILLICYLLPSRLPLKLLKSILDVDDLEKSLNNLYKHHLLEKSIDQKTINLESGIYFLFTEYKFFSEWQLQTTRQFLLKFFSKKKISKDIYHSFLFYVFFQISFLLKKEDGATYHQLQLILRNHLPWQIKRALYSKIFEALKSTPEKAQPWLCYFYTDILLAYPDTQISKEMQQFNDFLETKGEWNLFFRNKIALSRYFIFQFNIQKAKIFLAPVIEFFKNNTSTFRDIIDIAFLLIELGDRATFFSFLDYFSFENNKQNILSNNFDQDFIKAYHYYYINREQEALSIISGKINELELLDEFQINIARYSKIYAIYIYLCGKFKEFTNAKKFITKIESLLAGPYYPLGQIFSAIFKTVSTYKGIYKNNNNIDENFILLLEKIYSFAKSKEDQNISVYADILGKMFYEIDFKDKSKIYLREYYEK